jgi:hypothetical protein
VPPGRSDIPGDEIVFAEPQPVRDRRLPGFQLIHDLLLHRHVEPRFLENWSQRSGTPHDQKHGTQTQAADHTSSAPNGRVRMTTFEEHFHSKPPFDEKVKLSIFRFAGINPCMVEGCYQGDATDNISDQYRANESAKDARPFPAYFSCSSDSPTEWSFQ